ncbi:MAG: hypothetical protein ACOWWM_20855 [Desulfobacterales bacterium]
MIKIEDTGGTAVREIRRPTTSSNGIRSKTRPSLVNRSVVLHNPLRNRDGNAPWIPADLGLVVNNAYLLELSSKMKYDPQRYPAFASTLYPSIDLVGYPLQAVSVFAARFKIP